MNTRLSISAWRLIRRRTGCWTHSLCPSAGYRTWTCGKSTAGRHNKGLFWAVSIPFTISPNLLNKPLPLFGPQEEDTAHEDSRSQGDSREETLSRHHVRKRRQHLQAQLWLEASRSAWPRIWQRWAEQWGMNFTNATYVIVTQLSLFFFRYIFCKARHVCG